jgi:type I restriction enzyme, S subunit
MGNVRDGEISIPEAGGVDVVHEYLLLKAGDLLFNRTNSAELVGKVGIFRGHATPVTYASYLVRLRCNQQFYSEYMNYLLNSIPVLSIARALAIPSLHQSNLNPTRYGRIVLPFPSYEEQEDIVEKLSQELQPIDIAITKVTEEIMLIHEYRTRLIADVVTGKIDVRGLAYEMPEEFDENELSDSDIDVDADGLDELEMDEAVDGMSAAD